MSNQSLADLRNKFKGEEKSGENSNRPNNYYRFYDMKEGETCKVRFLPDANGNNPFGFLVQKTTHNLDINGERKTVECLSMYEQDCPVCKVSQAYYKEKDEVNGKKYWKKKSYIAQVLIVEDPLPANAETGETAVGKHKFINLGYQLYNIIQEAFKSEDVLDAIPYNYEDGYDFIIKKTKSGKYDAYNVGTNFARRQRALSEEEMAVVAEKLVDLSTLLPKNPGVEKVDAMLQAALTGVAYSDSNASSSSAPKNLLSNTPPASDSGFEDEIPFNVENVSSAQAAPAAGDDEIDKTLEIIKARRAAQKALQG